MPLTGTESCRRRSALFPHPVRPQRSRVCSERCPMRGPWPLHAQEQIASFNGKFAESDVPEDETAAEGESRIENKSRTLVPPLLRSCNTMTRSTLEAIPGMTPIREQGPVSMLMGATGTSRSVSRVSYHNDAVGSVFVMAIRRRGSLF